MQNNKHSANIKKSGNSCTALKTFEGSTMNTRIIFDPIVIIYAVFTFNKYKEWEMCVNDIINQAEQKKYSCLWTRIKFNTFLLKCASMLQFMER